MKKRNGLPVWRFAMRRWWGKEMHPHKKKDVLVWAQWGMDFRGTFVRN